MLAHMHNRMSAKGVTQPEIEGQVIVRWHQIGGMVGLGRVDVIAARRLQGDNGIAEFQNREFEPVRWACLRRGYLGTEEGVVLRIAPAVLDLLADGQGQRGILGLIGVQRHQHAALARETVGQPVGRASHHLVHKVLGIFRDIRDLVARIRQVVQRQLRGRRRVQPDAIGEPPILVGIVGQHQRDLAIGRGNRAQLGPIGRQFGHEIHPPAVGLIGGDGAFGGRIEIGFTLEADRARQDAAIHFGQGHIHRDIAGRQTAQAFGPGPMCACGQHNLKHRRAVGGLRGEGV